MAKIQKQFETLSNGLLVRAPGKINLSLLVKGKRADGYHDIESIMAKIGWYDEILIEKVARDSCLPEKFKGFPGLSPRNFFEISGGVTRSSDPCLRHTGAGGPDIELICKGEYKVPEGEENLVYKAAKLILDSAAGQALRNSFGISRTKSRKSFRFHGAPPYDSTGWKPVPRLKITLMKNMPAGSGLGSGSSDAAATLMGVNKFLKLGLSKGKLSELAAQLGSDIAFFLDGPLAFCTGRGEKVKKLFPCEFRVFLIVPDVSVSTKRVYENYRHDEARFKQLHKQISGYIVKKRIDLVCGMCANMLTESCFELHPELEGLKTRMESLGIRPVSLSGSGSSMFCVINKDNEEGAKRYKDTLEREYGCNGIIININS